MCAENVTTAKARTELAEIINRTTYAKERVVLTRRGKRVAAVVSVEDLELLEAIEDRIDLDAALKSLAETGKKGTVSCALLKSELCL